MRIVATAQLSPSTPSSDGFHVIGLSFPTPMRQPIAAAFPHAIFYTAAADLPEQTQALCDLLGNVVLFTYLPAIVDQHWLRASALFHLDTVKVVGVHANPTGILLDRAFEAELSGLVQASAAPTTFLQVARSVQQGELWFPRGFLSDRARKSASFRSPATLSGREAELLDLLAHGLTNQAIADRLFVTRETVRWHLRSIYTKLGVSDRAAALRHAQNRLAQNHLAREPQRNSA